MTSHCFDLGVPEKRVEMINDIFYLGQVLGCILIARVPDLYGRKWPFLISIAVQLPIYIALLFSTNLDLTIFLSFFMGFLHIGIYNGGYINVCEYVDKPWKNHVCTILLVLDMLSAIMVGVYFHYVSRNWVWFGMIGVLFNFVSLIGIYFIPESPEYLYYFYRFEECRAALSVIAHWNHVSKVDDHIPHYIPVITEKSNGRDKKFDVEMDLK